MFCIRQLIGKKKFLRWCSHSRISCAHDACNGSCRIFYCPSLDIFKFLLVRRTDFCFQLIIISSNIIFCSFFLFSSHSFFLFSSPFWTKCTCMLEHLTLTRKSQIFAIFVQSFWFSFRLEQFLMIHLPWPCIYLPTTFILPSPTRELLIQIRHFSGYRNYI